MTTPKVEPPKDEVTNMLDVMLDNFMLVHGTRNARTPQSKVELKAEILDYVKLQQEALLDKAYWAVDEVNMRRNGHYDAQEAINKLRLEL